MLLGVVLVRVNAPPSHLLLLDLAQCCCHSRSSDPARRFRRRSYSRRPSSCRSPSPTRCIGSHVKDSKAKEASHEKNLESTLHTHTMYPPKQDEYYPSAPPPAAMGFPVGGPSQYYPPQAPVEWSTGLCECGADCGNCCMSCCCPCVTFGRVAEVVDRGSTSCGTSGAVYALLEWFTCCHWIYSCMYRSKMRAQYNLKEGPCNDCFLHCCCEPCALSQEYRELKNRGFDMSIGWQANMERQALGTTLPPVTQGGMMR